MALRDQRNDTPGTEPHAGPVVLIVSPHAGQTHRDPAPHELLQSAGITVGRQLDVRDLSPEDPQGHNWRKDGYTAAVAAGGDGTIGSVATQLAGSDLPLGILPMGTSNDVARALGVPLDLPLAARTLGYGVTTEVDTGQARLLGSKRGSNPWVCFVHAATLGLNAEFARLATDVTWRQQWGNLTYATAALEAVLHMPSVSVKIEFSGLPRRNAPEPGKPVGFVASHIMQADVMQLAIVNTPIFGGPMNLQLPLSHPRDQLLDFVIIETLGPSRMLEVIQRLVSMLELKNPGGHRPLDDEPEQSDRDEPAMSGLILPGVWQIQAHSASIETELPADVTLDGELGLQTPIEIRVAPDPLRVLLPQGRTTVSN
ncbi:MAG: diacylglycerol/lipid kinase family protein [Ktedonobacterales bacterium]